MPWIIQNQMDAKINTQGYKHNANRNATDGNLDFNNAP